MSLIYIAARYGRREEMRGVAKSLSDAGHTIVSRWIGTDVEDEKSLSALQKRQFVRDDIRDLIRSEVFICFTELESSIYARGGRHVEFGFALALGKQVIVVGHLENFFHYLEEVQFVGSKEELCLMLGGKSTPEPVRYAKMLGYDNYLVGSDGSIFSKHPLKSEPIVVDGSIWWPMKQSINKHTNRLYVYPQCGEEKKEAKPVHEAVLEAFNGPRPFPYLQGRHLNGKETDNRSENLAWGTQEENQADRIRHGTSNRGERQGMSKLTRDIIFAIRRQAAEGMPTNTLAKKYDISRSAIYSILSGKTWGWLT